MAKKKKAERVSLRSAINDFCRSCIYDPAAEGSWRAQVRACTAPACPLYKVRPRTTAKDKE
jgi:hypothetical protein